MEGMPGSPNGKIGPHYNNFDAKSKRFLNLLHQALAPSEENRRMDRKQLKQLLAGPFLRWFQVRLGKRKLDLNLTFRPN